MAVRINRWATMALAVTALTAGAQAANAQAVVQDRHLQSWSDYPTVQEQIEDTFFGASGNYYRNTSLLGTGSTFIGPFPENNIVRDAQATNELINELWAIQNTSDPTIRTIDLATPFDSSVRLLPPYEPPVPAPRPAYIPPIQQTAPSAPTRPQGPVRGLY